MISSHLTFRHALGLGVSALSIAIAGSAHAQEASAVAGVQLAAAEADDAAPASAAAASDVAVDGGEIFVTARRREESAQDVPVALSVVDAAALERTGNYTLGQIQQLVPSLQVVNTNPRNTNVTIRGLGANSSLAVDGLEYGVGFYLDGVYYGRPGQSQFDLVDLQQIEVLRGPQGTLFGKNTTAGAVNITSRLPSFSPEFSGEATLGDYGYHQVRASVSGPLIGDTVAVRLSVADTHRDGFLTNLYDNRKANDYDNFIVRGQLLIEPVADLSIRLIGDYAKQTQHYILNLHDGYFTAFANGAPIGNNIFDRAARLDYELPDYDAFARLGNANSHFQANMASYGVSGQADWDLGPATLTSITAYRWWDWYPANDADNTSLPINLLAQQENFQRQFSQELRVASNGSNFIDYVAGLYYFWQIVRGYGQIQYGSDFADWNLNPAVVPAPTIALTDLALTDFESDSFSDPSVKSYAAFGQVDVHFTDALTLTAGLRFTHEDKVGSFTRFQVADSGLDLSGLSDAELAAVAAIRNNPAYQMNPLAFSAKTKDDALGGLVTLSYQPTRDVLLYATYSRGSKSGGLNVTAGGADNPVVDPEKVANYEIGLKTQFLDNALTFNTAAFVTEITDYQTAVSEPIPGTTTFFQYIANIPKVRSKGIEADLAYAPTDWLSLTASAAYTDAKYVEYTNSPQAPERTNEGAVQDLSGIRLPGVSKFAYTLGADVWQPVDETFEAYAHADWLHRSGFNSSSTNSAYSELPAYGLLNGRIGLRTADGRFDFAFWARNLTNEKYYISRGGTAFGLITAVVGDPRTVGATFRMKI